MKGTLKQQYEINPKKKPHKKARVKRLVLEAPTKQVRSQYVLCCERKGAYLQKYYFHGNLVMEWTSDINNAMLFDLPPALPGKAIEVVRSTVTIQEMRTKQNQKQR